MFNEKKPQHQIWTKFSKKKRLFNVAVNLKMESL